MELLSPICDAKLKPHLGKHVCVILHDGTTIYGTLGGLNGQQLMLGSCLQGAEALSTNAVQAKSQLQKNSKKAKVNALGAPGPGLGGYPGFGYPGQFGLDLALIALLFAIPFLWI